MIEALRHFLGLCGEHWHPNLWTAFAGSPAVIAAIYYFKSCCGGWFKHKKGCKEPRE